MSPNVASPASYELVELFPDATEEEKVSMADIWMECCKDEITWQLMARVLSPEAGHAWVRKLLVDRRVADEHMRVFVIKNTATGEMAAWTMLQVPYTPTNEDKVRQARQREEIVRAMPSEINKDYFAFFSTALISTTTPHGYDPEKDFHKRSTMCRPAYQRQGLGVWLTKHCDSIADESGRPTFVLARPKAWGMLEKSGFELKEAVHYDYTRFGGPGDVEYRVYQRNTPDRP